MEWQVKSSWEFTKLKWLDKYLEGHKGYIAGGCFKQIFTNEKVKDLDIFFHNEKDYLQADTLFKENKNFSPYYFNDKVTAYKHNTNGIVIELIKSVFNNPRSMLESFDFTITKFAYYKYTTISEEQETINFDCIYHQAYFEHLILKRTVIDDKITIPVNTFERMIRYTKYGYYPCRETKKKIISAIHDLAELPDVTLSLYNGLD